MSKVSDLMDAASAATGLHNFGDDAFKEGLERLVDSIEREARLNHNGRVRFRQQSVMLLTKRLEVEDWYARHPEIDDQEIVAPLVGLGLPRTGSTVLHSMLAQDRAVRVLRNWEHLSPTPPLKPRRNIAIHA